MTKIVEIESIETDNVKPDANGRGEKTFTVTNITGGSLRMGLQCQFENEEQKDWARPRGEIERELGDQGSDQVIVDITAPKDAAPGKYEFKLLCYKTQSPNLDFTVSDSIYIEVPEPEPEEEKKPFRWWIPVTAVVFVLLIGGGILTWVLWPSKMPDVVGKPVDEAIATLEEKGILTANINIVEEHSGGVAEGEVRTQEPNAEEKLEDKNELQVHLVVEAFTRGVPDLTGKTVAEAEEVLSSEGLKVGTISQEKNNQAAGGTILKTDPVVGQRVVPDTAINLTVVTSTIQVPNLAGQKLFEAKRALEKLGLRVGVEQVQTAGEALRVLSTKPASPESVLPGSLVVLVVVKQMVTVANMIGQTEAQAKNTIRKLNLKLGAVRLKATSSRRSGTVINHIPARGATVAPLSRVTLIVARTPPRPTVAARGNLQIIIGQKVDLDRGRIDKSSAADIMINGPSLVRINKAFFGRKGSKAVGWKGCRKSRYTTAAYKISTLKNQYICVRTQQGKYAELHVTAVLATFNVFTIKFTFTTWKPPKPLKKAVTAKTFSTQALQGLKLIRRELEPALGLEPE